jgi:hypothetical protein
MRLSIGAQLKRYRDGRCEIVGVYPGNGHSAGDVGVPVGSFVVASDDIPIHHIVDENCNWIADKRHDVPMAWKVVDGTGNDLGMFYPAFETINEDDDSIQVRPAFEDTAEADDVPGQEPTKPFKDEEFVFESLKFSEDERQKIKDEANRLARVGHPEETARAEDISEAVEAETQEAETQQTGGISLPAWQGDSYAPADGNRVLPRLQLVEQRDPADHRPWFISPERSKFESDMVASAARSAAPQSAVDPGYRAYRIEY